MVAGGFDMNEDNRAGSAARPSRYDQGPRKGWYQGLPAPLREYAVEIGLLAMVLVAVFLLLEPWDIRATLRRWAVHSSDALTAFLDAATDSLFAAVGRLTLSDATAVILLLVVGLVSVLRLRWRLIHSERLWNTACPKCGYSKLHRIHRRMGGRLLSALGIPVGRYYCRNCKWQGLRIRRPPSARASLPQAPAGK